MQLGEQRIAQLSLPEAASILAAMRVIDAGSCRVALVVGDHGRLVGLITDGDIRRGLLAGASLHDPVKPFIQRRCTSVPPGATRVEVLDLMRARQINQIPIVDERGILTGLHLLHEIVTASELPHTAVIMAGGRGERLRPLTDSIPKPMLKVAGRPILERLVLHLVGLGFRDVYISINYLGHLIEEHFGAGDRFGCTIRYLKEDTPLGTGGALTLLPAQTHPVVVLNGDVLLQADLGAMVRFHELGGYVATIGTREYAHQLAFGCVEVEASRLISLQEKPLLRRLINAGIYVLNPELIGRIPRGTAFPLTQLFERTLQEKLPVGAYAIEDDWIDIGQKDQLRQAREGA